MAATTMKTLCERVEDLTGAKLKKIKYEINASYYNTPFAIDHLRPSVEIQYVSQNHAWHQPRTGLTGHVYLANEKPTPTCAFRDERTILFRVFTDKTDKKAYMKMFDLCTALANNTEKALRETMENESR